MAKNTANIKFQIEVGKKANGFGLKAPSKNNGQMTFDFKSTPANVQSGWYAIQVMEPTKRTSNKAPFQVTCKKKLDAGNGFKSNGNPPSTPNATDQLKSPLAIQWVKLHSAKPKYTGTCPATIKANATVRASGFGKIKYRWQTSKGYQSAPKSVHVNGDHPHTHSFAKSFDFKTSQTGNITLQILTDNGKSRSLSYNVQCKLPLKAPGANPGIKGLKTPTTTGIKLKSS